MYQPTAAEATADRQAMHDATATPQESTVDTYTAFMTVRQALATIVALQPEDSGTTVSAVGTTLIIKHADGTGEAYAFQHVAGGTMRAVRTALRKSTATGAPTATPLTTNQAVTDYLRALVVVTLR
jgi:hypothetical protein